MHSIASEPEAALYRAPLIRRNRSTSVLDVPKVGPSLIQDGSNNNPGVTHRGSWRVPRGDQGGSNMGPRVKLIAGLRAPSEFWKNGAFSKIWIPVTNRNVEKQGLYRKPAVHYASWVWARADPALEDPYFSRWVQLGPFTKMDKFGSECVQSGPARTE